VADGEHRAQPSAKAWSRFDRVATTLRDSGPLDGHCSGSCANQRHQPEPTLLGQLSSRFRTLNRLSVESATWQVAGDLDYWLRERGEMGLRI
jgi:hypothetical protein